MGQCSFFYDMDNHDNETTTTPKPSHGIPAADPQPTNDEESLGYFQHGRPRYRNRRLNPRAVAHAIKTRAKRQWTERRYRRRLRQSQLQFGGDGGEINGARSSYREDEFTYELTKEHRQAFHAAHSALNGHLANEYSRNRGAIRKQFGYDYDLDHDLELQTSGEGEGEEDEIRADLTKSSLAIRGGQIRMPVDNVRLVCDNQLQSGILSIETRDVSGGMMGYENFGNANRYGNIHGSGIMAVQAKDNTFTDANGKRVHVHQQRERSNSKESISEQQWRRQELAYVLTVDEHIYQRVVQEMGDSYRIPCDLYYCCHGTDGGDHAGIGIAILILLVVLFVLVLGMIAWPNW